jgi:hypothetical protein
MHNKNTCKECQDIEHARKTFCSRCGYPLSANAPAFQLTTRLHTFSWGSLEIILHSPDRWLCDECFNSLEAKITPALFGDNADEETRQS